MSESANRLKANKTIAGKPCGWCSRSIEFGEEVTVCQTCEFPQHTGCWDDKGGCATADCINAPLKQLEIPEAKVIPSGMRSCPHCGELIPQTDLLCVYCNKAPTPDGVYYGPKENAPGAVASMVWGILGLFICGVIFGIIAISKSREANKAIAADPQLKGSGFATAGMVMGILDLVFWGLAILVQIGSM